MGGRKKIRPITTYTWALLCALSIFTLPLKAEQNDTCVVKKVIIHGLDDAKNSIVIVSDIRKMNTVHLDEKAHPFCEKVLR